MVDGRYLVVGWLSNMIGILIGMISLFLGFGAHSIIVPLLFVTSISGSFTVVGFLKKGSLNSATAEGLLLGNFPIWIIGMLSIPLSVDSYEHNLSLCQDHIAGYLASSYECTIVTDSLYYLGLLSASLAIALAVTFASLLSLRRLSARN